jgi:hypothetical protein
MRGGRLRSCGSEDCSILGQCEGGASVGDEIRAAHIDVVRAAGARVFHMKAGVVVTEVGFEAHSVQPVQQILVQLAARFDVRDGRVLCLPALRALQTYPVTVIDGQVMVNVDAKSATAEGDPLPDWHHPGRPRRRRRYHDDTPRWVTMASSSYLGMLVVQSM